MLTSPADSGSTSQAVRDSSHNSPCETVDGTTNSSEDWVWRWAAARCHPLRFMSAHAKRRYYEKQTGSLPTSSCFPLFSAFSNWRWIQDHDIFVLRKKKWLAACGRFVELWQHWQKKKPTKKSADSCSALNILSLSFFVFLVVLFHFSQCLGEDCFLRLFFLTAKDKL